MGKPDDKQYLLKSFKDILITGCKLNDETVNDWFKIGFVDRIHRVPNYNGNLPQVILHMAINKKDEIKPNQKNLREYTPAWLGGNTIGIYDDKNKKNLKKSKNAGAVKRAMNKLPQFAVPEGQKPKVRVHDEFLFIDGEEGRKHYTEVVKKYKLNFSF